MTMETTQSNYIASADALISSLEAQIRDIEVRGAYIATREEALETEQAKSADLMDGMRADLERMRQERDEAVQKSLMAEKLSELATTQRDQAQTLLRT